LPVKRVPCWGLPRRATACARPRRCSALWDDVLGHSLTGVPPPRRTGPWSDRAWSCPAPPPPSGASRPAAHASPTRRRMSVVYEVLRSKFMSDSISTAVDVGLATRATAAGPREAGAKVDAFVAGHGGAP